MPSGRTQKAAPRADDDVLSAEAFDEVFAWVSEGQQANLPFDRVLARFRSAWSRSRSCRELAWIVFLLSALWLVPGIELGDGEQIAFAVLEPGRLNRPG